MNNLTPQKVTQYSLAHRPKVFENVKGQDNIVKEMLQRSKMNKFPSAMLFQGPTGTGKTTLAFLAAAAIQCKHKDEKGNPCGECATCKDIFDEKFSRGCTHMLDGSSSSKDDVIDLIEQTVHTVPLHGPKHVFIIEEIDQLSTAAKNSFHKFLEKPSPYVHFILLSMADSGGSKVPQSIMDRCQPYYFKNITERDVAYTLKHILAEEGLWDELPAEFKKEGIFLIVNNAKGSLRRAIQFLERAMIGEFFTVKEIEDNFKFLSESSSLGTLKMMIEGEGKKLSNELEAMRKENKAVDWVFLVSFFLFRHRQNVMTGEKVDESPSSSLLGKLYSKQPAVYKELEKGIKSISEEVRHGSYMTSTHVSHLLVDLYEKIEKARKGDSVPYR